jgi:toxin CcdB
MARSRNLFADMTSRKMAQFDVFPNPFSMARRAYPFVVSLQSDFALNESDQIVAPLVPMHSMPKSAGRLTPGVTVNGAEHVVIVPRLTAMRTRDLGQCVSSIASSRGDLLAAIDYLFFGV